jgi:hypothetical protein
MLRQTILVGIAALLSAASVRAEEPTQVLPQERFSMTPGDGGFLRLDKQTGAVSFCTIKDGLSLCRATADERAALESEVARLRRENGELKNRLAESPAPRTPGTNLPNEEEFERSLSFTERFLRRMMRVFREEAPCDRT